MNDSLITIQRGHNALPALSELTRDGAVDWAAKQDLPPYRGRQLYDALWRRGLQDINDLTTYPRGLRERLQAEYRTRTISPRLHLYSRTDRSEKVLFSLADGSTVESVLIRSRGSTGRERVTVCVSSQVGCPAGCTFCATGLGGFMRNLTTAEIADQVMYFAEREQAHDGRVTNVVFMGMGEPLLNVRHVQAAVHRLTDAEGFNLSERALTVSTVGIIPQVRKYASWAGQVNLAISLHAPNNALRSQLVPYNDRFPIEDLLEAVREYTETTNRRVSFEYVLLKGVNDSPALAPELAALLRPLGGLAHVNLIPWNPFRAGRFIRSEGPDAEMFAEIVRHGGVRTTVRYSKGLDISAACGQLRDRLQPAADTQETF